MKTPACSATPNMQTWPVTRECVESASVTDEWRLLWVWSRAGIWCLHWSACMQHDTTASYLLRGNGDSAVRRKICSVWAYVLETLTEPLFSSKIFSQKVLQYLSRRILRYVYGVLNVDEKKLIAQFSWKLRDECFEPNYLWLNTNCQIKMKVLQ